MEKFLCIFESLFGCHHQQLSRAFTIRRRTYRVCIKCGREFEYSWELMHSKRSIFFDSAYALLNHSSNAKLSVL
jgi:hypothetical protein